MERNTVEEETAANVFKTAVDAASIANAKSEHRDFQDSKGSKSFELKIHDGKGRTNTKALNTSAAEVILFNL